MSLIPLGFWAASGGGAGGTDFDLLETTVLASAVSSVTFTSLSSYTDYKHLQVRAVIGGTSGTGAQNLAMEINDSPFNTSHWLMGNGSSVVSGKSVDSNVIRMNQIVPTGSGEFGAAVIDILDFNNANKRGTIRGLGGHSASTNRITLGSGFEYLSASAINKIVFKSNENFSIATRFSIYGVK
jgi:hypothetical protein